MFSVCNNAPVCIQAVTSGMWIVLENLDAAPTDVVNYLSLRILHGSIFIATVVIIMLWHSIQICCAQFNYNFNEGVIYIRGLSPIVLMIYSLFYLIRIIVCALAGHYP